MADAAPATPAVEMQDPKSILESKTFWGIVVALAMPTLAKHGIVIDPTGLTTDLSTVIGGLLAIYGRVTASAPVKLV